MKVSFRKLSRSAYAVLALALGAAGLIPAFAGNAAAYGQVTSRSIQLSNSAANASGVNYLVTFTPVTTATTIQAIAVDFCSNTPIIGDSCTLPTSFSLASSGVSGITTTGQSGGTWTAGVANTNRTFTLSNGSSTSTPSGAWNFTITGVNNPNMSPCATVGTTPNCSFYARIFTFSSTGNLTTWLATGNGSATATALDAGGVALSTTATITVTSKVQETLTFCVYTGANCAAGGAAVTLGNYNGVLDIAGEFVDKHTKFDLASNAAGGVTVRFTAPTLTSGGNNIDAIGGTETATNPGNEQFGLCAYRSSGSLLAVDTDFDGVNGADDCSDTVQNADTAGNGGNNTPGSATGNALFRLDTTASATSGYGDTIATMAAGVTNQATIAFMANIHPTTPAGIYTSDFNFVATGIY